MIQQVQCGRSVADSILSYAMDAYPREGILIMRGKVKDDVVLVDDLLVPPLATHGLGFSGFPRGMIPFDLSIIGIVHSHPSGALKPSMHDLNHFYGKIMAITAYPFQSYSDIAVFNSRGDKIQLEIVPDRTLEPNGQEF